MANLLLDSLGRPVPQYYNQGSDIYEALAGTGGAMNTRVTALPTLPAGTNNIGKVDVNALPALPAGANNIGKVDVNALPALPAGSNNIGKVDVNALPALPAGSNNIGKVDVSSLPAPVGNTAAKVTLAAGVASQVKASPGIVYKISTALTDVEVRNASTTLWADLGKESFEGGIACTTDITLYSATGGDVYILYK